MMIHAEPRYYGYLPGAVGGPSRGKRILGPISYEKMLFWQTLIKLRWVYSPAYAKKEGRGSC